MKHTIAILFSLLIINTATCQTTTREHAKELALSGDLNQAITIIDKVIAASTPRAVYYLEKASYQVELKDYSAALKTLTIGINIMPDSASFYDARGTLLEAFGLYKEAIEDFTMGYNKAQDKNLKSHLLANRGGTKTRTRDFQGSYADLMTAIKLDSTNKAALNNLAAICDEVNRPNETLKYLQKIISIDPNYAPAYINIGYKYQGLGQHEKALEYFNKAVALDATDPLAFSNRSFSKLKTKDLKGALEDINLSLSIMPTNSYAYKIRGLIEIEKKNSSGACADFNRAIELGYPQQYGDEVDKLIAKYCKD
jgi:Tfp pilus assembly protein PilF